VVAAWMNEAQHLAQEPVADSDAKLALAAEAMHAPAVEAASTLCVSPKAAASRLYASVVDYPHETAQSRLDCDWHGRPKEMDGAAALPAAAHLSPLQEDALRDSSRQVFSPE